MTTKGDKAKRSMLTQGESETQDNIQTIANNRNQVKAIGFKGIAHDTTSNYEKEANEFLAEQGSSGKFLTTERHTAAITNSWLLLPFGQTERYHHQWTEDGHIRTERGDG
jgi:hypothetical protein